METLQRVSQLTPTAQNIIDLEVRKSGLSPEQTDGLMTFFEAASRLDSLQYFGDMIPQSVLDRHILVLDQLGAIINQDPVLARTLLSCQQNLTDALYENEP